MSKSKIGGRQRASRTAKIERLVGRKVIVNFNLERGETIILKDIIEKRENSSKNGYFLKNYSIHLPLKHTIPREYNGNLEVAVSRGSYVEQQLKDSGVLK